MHHTILVQFLDAEDELGDEKFCLLLREALLLFKYFVKLTAIEEWHDNEHMER